MYYSDKNILELIEKQLQNFEITQDLKDLILSNIHQSGKDENFWYTPYDMDAILEKQSKGLSNIFHGVSKSMINWIPTKKDGENTYVFKGMING